MEILSCNHKFSISDHTGHIIDTWKQALYTTSVELVEAMAFNVDKDHALHRKYKTTYLEGNAKFIVEVLMEDK